MDVCYAGMIRLVKICKQRQLNFYGIAGETRAAIHCILGNNGFSNFSNINCIPLKQAPIKNKGMRTKESLLPLPYSGLIRNFPCHFLLI